MIEFLKSRWVLLPVLIIFITCKIPYLHYAYYWDECWPYAVAIKDLYKHGVSLMPTAIDPELSRGHPLFFHSFAVIWINIFGASHVSMHSFALSISVLCLIAVYETGYRLFNQRVAIMSLLLVAIQVVFFVQSSFVLPEILIAFLAFISLYFYVTSKYLLTAVSLVALFFSKESGLVMGFVLGIDAVASFFNENDKWKTCLYRFVSVAVPCVLIMAFFLIQKHYRGWYVFPQHSDLIVHNWDAFWHNFRTNSLHSTIVRDNRYWYFILLLALLVLTTISSKNYSYFIFFLPAFLIYCFVSENCNRSLDHGHMLFISFVLSLILMLYVLEKLKIYNNPYQKKFIVLSVAFILCFFCFSAMNFFTPRYMLSAIIPSLFFCVVIIDILIARTHSILFYPVICLMSAMGLYAFAKNKDFGDCDPGAYDGLDVQQHVVNYFEKNNYYDKVIGSCSFLEYEHFRDPATGFLQSEKPFNNISWSIDAKTSLAIFDNIENDYRYDDFKKDSAFRLEYRYEKGRVWVEVYGRK